MINNIQLRTLALISIFLFVIAFIVGCEEILKPIYEKNHVIPPLTFTMRDSYMRGYVLQITNRAKEHLECEIYVINHDNSKKSETFHCVINSGAMQEVGHLELGGWYLDPNEIAVIYVQGYSYLMHVQWKNASSYKWGYITKDSDPTLFPNIQKEE